MSIPPSELATITPQLEALIREVGKFAAEEFARFDFNAVEYKAENDPFSFVDVEADRRLRTGCEVLIPGAGFINEELENREGENDWRWIIDPIDGTSNFTHGVPHFCISLALQYREETQLGYVFQPITQELFYAQKGQGAFLNGTPIQRSQRKEIKQALAATGFPYAVEAWVADYLKMIYEVIQATHGLRRFGSAALDMAYVASGRLDVFFEYGLKPWDMAAGGLIITEAGGEVSNFWGESEYLFGGGLIASNGWIHREMVEILGKSQLLTYINR